MSSTNTMQEIQAERSNTAHRSGDAAPRALLGDGAVIVWNDVAPEGREQFYEWHDKEHIPERLAIPGFLRGRRYIHPGHSPEWLTLYEANDLDVVTSPHYLQRLNSPTAQTVQTLKFFRNTSRAVCRVLVSMGSSSGGHVLAMRLDAPGPRSDAMCGFLSSQVFPRALALTGIVACHLCAADRAASYTNTAESKTREFDVPSWVLLIEATRPQAAQRVRTMIETTDLQRLDVAIHDPAIYALEISRLSSWVSSS